MLYVARNILQENLPRVWTVCHVVATLRPSTHTFIGLSSPLGAGILHPGSDCDETENRYFPK